MKVSLCQSEKSKSESQILSLGTFTLKFKLSYLFISSKRKILGTLPKDGFNPQTVLDAMASVYTAHTICHTASYKWFSCVMASLGMTPHRH